MDQPMMTAIAVEGGRGGPEALKAVSLARPIPREGEILIRVAAAGVNRPDLLQRMGGYPPPPGSPDTLGLEVAGEVVQGAGRWRAGDQVCALLGGGGYAEYATVDARHALPVPAGLTLVEAAGLPETIFTVWANVFEHGALKAGETLLVHGATSGIGVTAIQMAKAAGARVIATARGAAKAARALELGADIAIDATAEDFGERVKAEGGADVVLDMVGGDYVAKNLKAVAMHGRIVMIAFQKGSRIEADWMPIMMKRLTFTGSTLRARSVAEKAEIARALESAVRDQGFHTWFQRPRVQLGAPAAPRRPRAAGLRAAVAFAGPAFLVSIGYMDPGNWGTDLAAGSSSFVVLDARDLAAGPVATVALPQRVPFGFHGNWMPAVD
jgi:putative PIG3 family NAD(P)H quinone oxidoreductase